MDDKSAMRLRRTPDKARIGPDSERKSSAHVLAPAVENTGVRLARADEAATPYTREELDAAAWVGYTYLAHDHFEEAIGVFEGLHEIDSRSGYYAQALAVSYLFGGRLREAFAVANRAAFLHRDPRWCLLIRAQAAAALGDKVQAAEDLRVILEGSRAPEAHSPLVELAKVLLWSLQQRA